VWLSTAIIKIAYSININNYKEYMWCFIKQISMPVKTAVHELRSEEKRMGWRGKWGN
jgi:hypothetical protein